MDTSIIETHLKQARRHVAEGEGILVRQRGLVAGLERDGHNATRARQLLESFEELQAMHVADRARLEKELADKRQEEINPPATSGGR